MRATISFASRATLAGGAVGVMLLCVGYSRAAAPRGRTFVRVSFLVRPESYGGFAGRVPSSPANFFGRQLSSFRQILRVRLFWRGGDGKVLFSGPMATLGQVRWLPVSGRLMLLTPRALRSFRAVPRLGLVGRALFRAPPHYLALAGGNGWHFPVGADGRMVAFVVCNVTRERFAIQVVDTSSGAGSSISTGASSTGWRSGEMTCSRERTSWGVVGADVWCWRWHVGTVHSDCGLSNGRVRPAGLSGCGVGSPSSSRAWAITSSLAGSG